jgi:hypothetical protein
MRSYKWLKLMRRWRLAPGKKIFLDTSRSKWKLAKRRLKRNSRLSFPKLLALKLSLTSKKKVSIPMLNRP